MTTAADPPNPAQALDRAFAAFQAGEFVAAEGLCRQIIALNPGAYDALYLLALAQTRLGQFDAALTTFDRVIDMRPDVAEAHINRGIVLQALDRHDAALAAYDRALALRPEIAAAHYRRGSALERLQLADKALASFERAVALRPDFAMAHFKCGNALLSLMRYDEAMAHYDRALAMLPDFAPIHSNRANALQHLKRYDEALSGYERALALRPDFADALYNRGNALMDLNRFDDALDSYDRALAVRPNFAVALSNRGNALQRLGRLEDALASYERALAIHPDYAEALCNRGTTLRRLNRHDEALASYAAAIAASPDHGEAHFGMATVLLLRGDFERGWKQYEWRWQAARLHNLRRTFRQPHWLGQDEITSKTILVYSEQGYGDTIQFCRYVPLLAERGVRVILQVREALKELMAGIAGAAQILSTDEPDSALPAFDMECPLVSLPLAFKTRLDTIPAAVPYLRAPPQRMADWDARLAPQRRPRIGLAWSGRTETLEESYRSIPLGALLPLLDIDATFVSLQKDVLPHDAPVLNKCSGLLHFADEIRDFADTAAIISHLDLVISIDTAVAHLAGALAKPVWVMLRSDPDWRWLLDRTDCPWYPSARLFRQDAGQPWESVIARVQTALRDFVQPFA